MFKCLSYSYSAGSFIKPSRKADSEITVLEAIKLKYGGGSADATAPAAVVISGKVAEEVGFDKIANEQARLTDLRIVLIDQLCISGVANRGCTPTDLRRAQQQLAETCPNITEIDLGWNLLETWTDVAHICASLPKLRTLRVR